MPAKPKKVSELILWFVSNVNAFIRGKLYGKITISFEEGNIVNLQALENKKPPKNKTTEIINLPGLVEYENIKE
jgi:hypothetical protein